MGNIVVKVFVGNEEVFNCHLPAVPVKGGMIALPNEDLYYVVQRVDFILDRKIKSGSAFFDHVHVMATKATVVNSTL